MGLFSAILGIGSSFLGARSANKQAETQYKMYMEQLDLQRQQQLLYYGMAMDAKGAQDQRNSELRDWEQWARMTAAQERAYQMQESERYADQLLQERQFEIDRQVRADQEAARIQAFRLQELLRNQRISAEERQFAIQQLERAQEIASEERTEDLKRYYADQERAKIQRDFMMGVYQDAQGIAREEQQRDLSLRDRITGQIDRLQGTVQAAYDAMGDAPTVQRLTKGDIDSEIARRTQQYTADVDRAADRVASINEADLIRGGMDRSTTGTAARGEVAGRLADEYQNARMRAYDDALKFITGQSDALTTNVNNIMGNRGAILQELSGVGGMGLDMLRDLPQVSSRLGALQSAQLVGDGIIDARIGSANNYQAPVGINSSIWNGMEAMTPAMSNFNVGTSGAWNRSNGVGSAITNPTNLFLDNPSSYFGYSNNASSNALQGAGNLFTNAQQRSDSASSLFGQNLTSFLNDYFGKGKGITIGKPGDLFGGSSWS